ncbi:MAG: nucleotide pyrophosphohydrolase [Candidatus Bathyarchaeota archaeon]|nr:nucleotide pyrophosphohydrolase [Candidatus Bathyarchaeota archaeon]
MEICEFQEMMKTLYFKRDNERGIEGNLDWLFTEVEELRKALKEKDKPAAEKEFADVLAWLASIANITGIDLEKAALDKYNHKCPKCKKSPCQCIFRPNASARIP